MRAMVLLGVFLLGACVGAAVTLLAVVSIQPVPVAAAIPGRSEPDISVAVSQKLVSTEAERRLTPVLAEYGLRNPRFNLQRDNAFTVDATATLPILGTDVSARAAGRVVVRDGGLAVLVDSIQYGMLPLPADQFTELTQGLNRSLADAIDRKRFQVEDVATTDGGITVKLKVIGPLTGAEERWTH